MAQARLWLQLQVYHHTAARCLGCRADAHHRGRYRRRQAFDLHLAGLAGCQLRRIGRCHGHFQFHG